MPYVELSKLFQERGIGLNEVSSQLESGGQRMKYGYTIIYVLSVVEALDFYKRAFGFETKFVLESKDYGELETGATTLAFASHALGDLNLGGQYSRASLDDKPFGMELSFTTDDVGAAFERAVAEGAIPIRAPEQKPWGQRVAYVRSIDGCIIELATPIGG